MSKQRNWSSFKDSLLLYVVVAGFLVLGIVLLYQGYASVRGNPHPTCEGRPMSPGDYCQSKTGSGSVLGTHSYNEMVHGGATFGNIAEMVIGVGIIAIVLLLGFALLRAAMRRSRRQA